MEPKKTKYDTNPLDPDVARKTGEVWGQSDDAPAGTAEIKGATQPVKSAATPESPRANLYSEAPTRRYDTPPLDSPYPSVFVPHTYAQPPDVYQPPPLPSRQPQYAPPTSRHVEGLGLPEKWALILPYVPAYIGLVASLIELLLVPRKEIRVRGHAAQGLALNASIMAIHLLFQAVAALTGSGIGGSLFGTASSIFLVISMIRVWQGATHRIAPLAELSEWLNKHIDPRK
jgi:uncharacterized membrane protein